MPSDHKPDEPEAEEPSTQKAKSFSKQFAMAMELPFILVAAVIVGGLVGYLLDRWLHTRLVFTLLLGGLGFYAGVRDILKRLPGSADGSKKG
jgi:ATP synthase protein I